MKDLVGNELITGDLVIMTVPRYSAITFGSVIGFTPKKVRIQYVNTWNYGNFYILKSILVDPETVCVFQGPQYELEMAKYKTAVSKAKNILTS